MQRRTLLSVMSLPVLAACGFELRRAPQMGFNSLYANFGPKSPLGTEFRRALAAQGQVRWIEDPAQLAQAQVLLDVLTDQREKAVVGSGATGQVREYQLRVRLVFKLRTPKGRELLGETLLLQQRDISYNETAALAKEQEEEQIYRDLQADVVQRLLRRLAAVKGV